MITCAHCGSTSETNKSFCSQCGNRLARPNQKQAATKAAASTPIVPTPVAPPVKTPSATRGPRLHFSPRLRAPSLLALSLLLALMLLWALAGTLPGLGRFPLKGLLDRILGTLPQNMIELAPEDSDLYLELQVGESEQFVLFESLLNRFPDARNWQNRFIDLFAVQDTSEGTRMSWENDIDPWLGEQIGIVADLLPDESGSLSAHMAFLFETEDHEGTVSFIQRLIDSEQAIHAEITYQKHTITVLQAIGESQITLPVDANSLSEPPLEPREVDRSAAAGYLVVVGDYLVVSNSYEYLTHMMDGWKTRRNFTHKAAYKEANALLNNQSLGKLFLDPHSMPASLFELVALPAWLFDVPLEAAAAAQQKSLPELLGFSLLATSEGIKLDLTLPSSGLDMLPRTLDRSLASYVPEEAVVYANLADLRAGIDNYFTSLSEIDPTMGFAYDSFVQRFQDEATGFDLDADILSLLADDGAVVLTYENGFPQLNFLVWLEDPIAAERQISRSIAFVESLLVAASTFTTDQQLNADDFSLFAEVKLPGDIPASRLQYSALPSYLDIVYARFGRLLVVSSAPDGLASFLAVEQGQRSSLAEARRFSESSAALSEQTMGIVYFDRQRFFQVLSSLYQTTEAANEERINFAQLDAAISPWPDAFGYISKEEDGTLLFSLNLPIATPTESQQENP